MSQLLKWPAMILTSWYSPSHVVSSFIAHEDSAAWLLAFCKSDNMSLRRLCVSDPAASILMVLSLSVGSLTLGDAICHVKTLWNVLCSTEGLVQEPSWNQALLTATLTTALADSLTAILMRYCKITSVCCFKLLNTGIVYYEGKS